MPAHDPLTRLITNETHLLNIAATCVGTESLGPGIRSVVWVQGCPFRCKGCVAPDWIPFVPARQVRPEVLADELLANPLVTGLTLSGGEPMMQASALARVIRLARRQRDLTVISFSGFMLEQLKTRPPSTGVSELLAELDVLIDGPYRPELNDNRGLRGSSNQRIHHLTDRLRGFDFENAPRGIELRIEDGFYMMVGVPPADLVDPLKSAINRANSRMIRTAGYERFQARPGLD